MNRNLGTSDRLIRAIIAGLIATLVLNNVLTGILGITFIIFAGILALTSFFTFCPFYKIFGISTYKSK